MSGTLLMSNCCFFSLWKAFSSFRLQTSYRSAIAHSSQNYPAMADGFLQYQTVQHCGPVARTAMHNPVRDSHRQVRIFSCGHSIPSERPYTARHLQDMSSRRHRL